MLLLENIESLFHSQIDWDSSHGFGHAAAGSLLRVSHELFGILPLVFRKQVHVFVTILLLDLLQEVDEFIVGK